MLKLLLYTRLTITSKIWALFSFYINKSLRGTQYCYAVTNYVLAHVVFVNASVFVKMCICSRE